MRNLTEDNVTEAVVRSLDGCRDPRTRRVMEALVRHLHAFVREVEPTEAEWFEGIRFLTEVGHMCRGNRQEFILLSDTLGVSILVDAINHRKPAGATETSVFGPFHVPDAPIREAGASIVEDGEATVLVEGRVATPDGRPVAGAMLDVWQTAPNGLYDVQDPAQPEMNLRGRFLTDAEGRYAFRTVPPVSYPIPDDGPVGKMLRAVGRHPYRPAHIHFLITAEGHEPVTTMLFLEGDGYLDGDAVFGVKNSLVVRMEPDPAGGQRIRYDFGLVPVPATADLRAAS